MTPEQKRILAMKLAYLYSQGIPARKIAEVFPWLKPTRISHLLDHARDLEFLTDNPTFLDGSCSLREKNGLESLNIGYRLQDALQQLPAKGPPGPLRNVHVVPTGIWGKSPFALEQRMERFSSYIAADLRSAIAESRMCGVTWGMTLAKAVSALGKLDSAQFRNARRQFVALCGEPFSQEAHISSSSRIAEQLDTLQGGEGKGIYTLRGIPALIPPGYRRKRKAILDFFQKETAYGEIFGRTSAGRSTAIISQLDAVLTSVGNFEKPLGSFVRELMKVTRYKNEKSLQKLAYGDLGGALLMRESLRGAELKRFNRIASTWNGISTTDLRNVAKRSWSQSGPGVIVLAIGDNKAEVIVELIKQRLVNEIFLDQGLALALAKFLKLELK